MTRAQIAALAVAALIAGARVADALTITVIAPTPTARIRDKVDVYVNAETAFALTAAQVTLDGTTATLTPFASCGPSCVRLFAELIPAAPDGAKLLTVDLADASGATATTEAPFLFDRPVTVTLATKPGSVTGTTMRLRGTCDDNGAPCASLDLSFHTDRPIVTRTLLDVTAFDELFDLTPVANRSVLAVAVGHDGFLGGEGAQTATLYVNDSPRLVPVVQTTGAILDTDLRRVLHVNPFNRLPGPRGISIFDRATGTDTLLDTQAFDAGALTPNGAVWPGPDNSTTIQRNGAVENHPGTGARVAGFYLQWQVLAPRIAHWMNLATGAHIQLNNVGATLPAANGVLYFQRATGDLIRRDGNGETIVGSNLFPLATDGNLVVATTFSACGLAVYSSTGAVDPLESPPCSALQSSAWLRDGWVVYFKSHALPAPPWVKFSLHSRGPDGTRYLLAEDLFGLGFDDISPSGEVMFHDGTRRFLVSPGGAPVEVAGSLGRGMWRDGHWLVAISDTLFALDAIPPIPAPPGGAPDASPDASPGDSPDASPGPPIDAGPNAEGDANPGPGGGLHDGGGGGCCSTGAAPPLLVLAIWPWLRRRSRSRWG